MSFPDIQMKNDRFLSKSHNQSFYAFVNAYNDFPFYKKWFFPGDLQREIRSYNYNLWIDGDGERSDNYHELFRILQIISAPTSRFQRWLQQRFFCIRTLSETPLCKSFLTIKALGEETETDQQNSRDALARFKLERLYPQGDIRGGNLNGRNEAYNVSILARLESDGLAALNKAGFLTVQTARANFNILSVLEKPEGASHCFAHLHAKGLLTGELAQVNFMKVIRMSDPDSVASILTLLQTSGLFGLDVAQENFNALIEQDQGSFSECYKKFESIYKELKIIQASGLLTGERAQNNFKVVVNKRSHAHANLGLLQDLGFFTGEAAQRNFDAAAACERLSFVSQALNELKDAGLLSQDVAQAVFEQVVAHEDPKDLSMTLRALNILKITGLLSGDAEQANRESVTRFPSCLKPLTILHASGLLTGERAQTNFDVVSKRSPDHGYPYSAMEELQAAGLLQGDLAQVNFDAITAHRNPSIVSKHLIARNNLLSAGLLDEEQALANGDIMDYSNRRIPDMINTLYKAGLLVGGANKDNLNILMSYDRAQLVFHFVCALKHEDQLNQANVDQLIEHRAILFFETEPDSYLMEKVLDRGVGTYNPDWSHHRVPFSQDHFDAIIAICRLNKEDPLAGKEAVDQYIHDEISHKKRVEARVVTPVEMPRRRLCMFSSPSVAAGHEGSKSETSNSQLRKDQ